MTPEVPDATLTARLDRIKKLIDELARTGPLMKTLVSLLLPGLVLVAMKLLLCRARPHRAPRIICALAVFALTSASPHAFGVNPATVVYPTGSFPLDVQNVQAAIDGGGTVILKATNATGQPTAFNFGPPTTSGGHAELTTDVTIVGERVGQSMTTINGGFAPFLDFEPVHSHIEGIDFEGPLDTPIALVSSTGAEIVGNVIRGIIPIPLLFGFTEVEGVFVSGFDSPVTGRIKIANNLIEISAGDFVNGMQLDEVAADIEISGNTVNFLQSTGVVQTFGILALRCHGKVDIVNNTVTMGPGDPDAIPVGIIVGSHPEARYTISGNNIMTNHPNADGMDVVGLGSFGGATHAARILNNHIVMHSLLSSSGGIALFGAVDNSIVSANTIEGTNANAIQILGLNGVRVADSNNALGNDVSRESPIVSDIFFGPFSTTNLVAGQCATYVDLGVGNHITCGTAVSSFAATTQATGAPAAKSKVRPLDIQRAILDTIQSSRTR
jgi:hypothetical protein